MATIITKNSSTASATPAAGDLTKGELAVNVTDKKLYTKDNSAAVVKIVGSLGNQEANAVAVTGGTVAGVAQTGGTINNTPIGGTTAAAVTGTVVTATTNFVGAITGGVTGNVTGNLTGNVTGNVTGALTGNVTAASGSSSFNNVTINGTLDMNSGTAATITGLPTPTNSGDAAPKSYVDTAISNLVGTAPATLDTLGEISDALNDDANIAATLTTAIAGKLPLAGGTMSGAIAMGTSKITGLGTPTAGTDATTKTYVDGVGDLKLPLAGGTMTGNIVMGANKVTSTATPSSNSDLTTKVYVDGILGSATAAATSASNAATSETNAANSASAASASASAAASSYDSFDDRYLGAKSSAPSVDNDGNALLTGALYWNSTNGELNVWSGSAWVPSALTTGAQTITGVKTFSDNPILSGGTANGVTYLNGSKVLTSGSALTFDGTSLDLATVGAKVNFATTSSATRNYVGGSADGYSLEMVTQRGASQPLTYKQDYSVGHVWSIAGSGAMTLTSTGLGIGTSSPVANFRLTTSASVDNTAGIYIENTSAGTSASAIARYKNNGSVVAYTGLGSSNRTSYGGLGANVLFMYTDSTAGIALTVDQVGPITFNTTATERVRITSDGNLLVGASSQASFFSAAAKMYVEMSGADYITAFRSTNASPSGMAISYSTTPNAASNYFIDARDNTAQRFAVKSNGGIDNYSGNNTNLSDRREKTNFSPATSYLDKICAIPVQTFNYIDQNMEDDGGLTLGVVAQDVQAVAPELVMESNWAKQGDEPKMRLSIYQTDLQYALMKALQELNAKFEAYKASHP